MKRSVEYCVWSEQENGSVAYPLGVFNSKKEAVKKLAEYAKEKRFVQGEVVKITRETVCKRVRNRGKEKC